MAQRPPVAHDLLIFDVSNSDTPHSVGLLWTSDRPIAEISDNKHSVGRHPYPGGIRTLNPSKRAAAGPHLRPRGNWDRPVFTVTVAYCEVMEQDSTPKHAYFNPYPTAFPYGNGMVLHFYQQQESSTTKTVHKVINKGLKTYV